VSIGYVQRAKYRGNDYVLSRARAVKVAAVVGKRVTLSEVKVTGKGRAKGTGKQARRATVTLTWTLTQR